MHSKKIGIFRTTYLLRSESFIREQAAAYSRYQPIFFGRDSSDLSETEKKGSVFLRAAGEHSWASTAFTLTRQSAKLKAAICSHGLSLIHAHFGPDGAMILPLARECGIPLIVTFHGFDAQMKRSALICSGKPTNYQYLLHENELVRDACCFIAVSKFIRDVLIRRGYPKEKIIVHYIGVDTEKFQPMEMNGREKWILNVSRHVSFKGVDTLLRACARVLASHADWKLVQVGAGSETDNLIRLSAELGISQQVIWAGAQSHSQVRNLMTRASIYVQASNTDAAGQTEAFGIVLLEAAASGLPIIATRSGGMPEAVLDGRSGYLFPERDSAALAKLLERLIGSETARELVGRAARVQALNFDIHGQTKKLESIYDAILNE